MFYVLDFVSGNQARSRNVTFQLYDPRTGSLVKGSKQPFRPGILEDQLGLTTHLLRYGIMKTYGITAPPSGTIVSLNNLITGCGFQPSVKNKDNQIHHIFLKRDELKSTTLFFICLFVFNISRAREITTTLQSKNVTLTVGSFVVLNKAILSACSPGSNAQLSITKPVIKDGAH